MFEQPAGQLLTCRTALVWAGGTGTPLCGCCIRGGRGGTLALAISPVGLPWLLKTWPSAMYMCVRYLCAWGGDLGVGCSHCCRACVARRPWLLCACCVCCAVCCACCAGHSRHHSRAPRCVDRSAAMCSSSAASSSCSVVCEVCCVGQGCNAYRTDFPPVGCTAPPW